ncbi:MAG: putative collagen-binding domain-containing protein, partial [Bacteroidota bacterium]
QEFDNTYHQNGNNNLKDWAPHIDDWQAGDPTWQNGKGKGIIGALNYLAEAEQNAFSFITNNIGGDGKNVWMYTDPGDFFRFDVSKLAQWEIVFSHADQLGLYLHFKTQETENDQLLDGGALGNARKLYYRELIARFGHHLALNWNLGEENTQTDNQRIAMAEYFSEHDPYQHHIVIHTYPNDQENVYEPLLGEASQLTGASVQTNWSNVHERTLQWVEESANADKPWVVANDEQGNANYGVPPNEGYEGWNGGSPDVHDIRKAVLWGNLMAGGAGVEYYFGYSLPQNDLNCEDYRSRSDIWAYNALALDFLQTHIPYWIMRNRNELIGNDNNDNDQYCLANTGSDYVIYLAEGGSTDLLLNDSANVYQVRWFDPRNGGDLQLGTVDSLQGMGWQTIGDPPNDPDQDWAVWISRMEETVNSLQEVSITDLRGYPNPTGGDYWLQNVPVGLGMVQLFDPLGRLVYESPQRMVLVGEDWQVPMAALPPGLFTLRWSSLEESKSQYIRILKQ